MVSGPQGTPGCSPASIPRFGNLFLSVIIAIAFILAPARWTNIDNCTCLLTPSVALQGSQYQAMDGPLQGRSRSYKIPHNHHHDQFLHYCLQCLPPQRCCKWNSSPPDPSKCHQNGEPLPPRPHAVPTQVRQNAHAPTTNSPRDTLHSSVIACASTIYHIFAHPTRSTSAARAIHSS
jgi:hypothetical protein